MKDDFYGSDLWKNELETSRYRMLDNYDVILYETSSGYVCDGQKEGHKGRKKGAGRDLL